MDEFLKILRDIGLRKGSAVVCIVSALLLVVEARYGLIPGLSKYVPVAWLAFLGSAVYLTIEAIIWIINRGRHKSQHPNAAPEPTKPNPYAGLDEDEREVLKIFVDRHHKTFELKEFMLPNDDRRLVKAAKRLGDRNLLFIHSSVHSGTTATMPDFHWRALVQQPHLIGSKALPRSFG